jgi:ubiquinone/menaquinone biosynthesis C-methylase UbiE
MTFAVSGNAYDRFMGRYSRELAPVFADFAGIAPGLTVLDVGCGSGVLTEELARRVGAENVAGVDPSPLLEACAARVPGADLRAGAAERLPWPDDGFDAAIAQLVVRFMDDPPAGVAEMARVVRPGGVVAACSWDFADGMQMLRVFWQAARAASPEVAGETVSFGSREDLDELFRASGLGEVETMALDVATDYQDFDELWGTFLLGVGPSGQYAAGLEPDAREAVREDFRQRLGVPAGRFTLSARSWAVRGRVPSS